MMLKLSLLAVLTLGVVRADYPFAFKDVGDAAGVFPHAAGIRGHGAAWGDVDGDGWPDLFIGTFHNAGSKPAMLLRNDKGKFRLDPQLQISGIGSGALFADWTNSGRLDLYVSHCAHGKDGVLAVPSLYFSNDGTGKFTEEAIGACPPGYCGRGVAAGDFDGDGHLDLVTCEQYYSSKVKTGPVLYRNNGNIRFGNPQFTAVEDSGLPAGFGGLGVAIADVNGDGWPDIFLTGGSGDNRLYINDGHGKFKLAPSEVFRWKHASEENTPAGVAIADVNRDGRPDIVIGHHFKSPWTAPASIRLYLNRGDKGFEDVTDAAGLAPLAMKAPHVEIQDFDNDGWPDILTSIVKFDGETPCPVIYRNIGGGKFRNDAWSVNDFPTAEDKGMKRSGPLFDKILKEKKIIYMAAGPSADFDRDGKLDLFLANWWIESRSLLLRNETPGGHWLDVRVEGSNGVNRMGIGAVVTVSAGGKILGSREISAGYGYCSGQEAIAHFGLVRDEAVDVEVVLPHGKGTIVRKGVKADQRITVTAAKEDEIDKLTKAIEKKPSAELYSRRGGEYFKLGKFKESIADFDKQIALDPKSEEDHWRRGISLYYAERYDDGAKQFELGKKVYGNDVENAFWHYLCLARATTPAKAREKLLPIGADSRYYMPKVYELIAGRAKPEDLLAVVEASKVKDKTEGLFYTHLYIGLNHEAEGDAKKSLEHLKLAAEKYPSTHYMGDVARVHVEARGRK